MFFVAYLFSSPATLDQSEYFSLIRVSARKLEVFHSESFSGFCFFFGKNSPLNLKMRYKSVKGSVHFWILIAQLYQLIDYSIYF